MPQATDPQPTVSMVIPMRNEKDHIGPAIESILAADYPLDHIEILVVDAMSTDGSADVARSYAGRGCELKVVENPDIATPFGMNKGVRLASGDMIVIMSAHTAFEPGFVPSCLKTMREMNADVVGGLEEPVAADSSFSSRLTSAFIDSPFGPGSPSYRSATEDVEVDTVMPAIFKREVFEKAGLFDERLVRNQDNELSSRVIACGYKICLSVGTTVRYAHQTGCRGLMRKMFMNGKYGVVNWRISPSSFYLRHLVPFLWVLFVLLGGLASSLLPYAWIPYVGVVGLYLALAVICAIKATRKSRIVWAWPLLVGLFACIHFAYGLGTLIGVLTFGLRSLGDTGPEKLAPRAGSPGD